MRIRGLNRRCWLAILFAWGAFPALARAHGAIPGVEGVANGLLHPITTPSHLLIILAFGMLIGQRIPVDFKTPLTVFAPALAVALLLTLTGEINAVYLPILLAIALGIAVLVALQRPIPVWAMRVLAGVCALGIGLDSGIEGDSMATVLKTLLGTWLAVTILVFNVAYYSSVAVQKAHWMRIGLRVLASWILAVAVMMLAFSLRG